MRNAGPARTMHDEPFVTGWETATTDRACPGCREPIRVGDPVAVLDTTPRERVCADCIECD
jgi:hypothetical protein